MKLRLFVVVFIVIFASVNSAFAVLYNATKMYDNPDNIRGSTAFISWTDPALFCNGTQDTFSYHRTGVLREAGGGNPDRFFEVGGMKRCTFPSHNNYWGVVIAFGDPLNPTNELPLLYTPGNRSYSVEYHKETQGGIEYKLWTAYSNGVALSSYSSGTVGFGQKGDKAVVGGETNHNLTLMNNTYYQLFSTKTKIPPATTFSWVAWPIAWLWQQDSPYSITTSPAFSQWFYTSP